YGKQNGPLYSVKENVKSEVMNDTCQSIFGIFECNRVNNYQLDSDESAIANRLLAGSLFDANEMLAFQSSKSLERLVIMESCINEQVLEFYFAEHC
ncbi:3713_t:CDS:1, partial [Ambispora leptoticha]